ncbi:MAG: O-antigen ligase family protein, partial [Pseudobacter sp.]|uniref:O-antigen ligase family protein n=1 Tax=Pseudobacter sp. TaxID=2045420 RepID=UPI003F7D435E
LLAINSIFIMALALLWILSFNFRNKFRMLARDPLFWAYAAIFLVNAIGVLYAPDRVAGWKNAESKLGFLILPLIFCSSGPLPASLKTRMLTIYSIAVTAASLLCLVIAFVKFNATKDPGWFFYHELVEPLKHHAVYYSVFTFISVAFLLFEYKTIPWLANRKWLMRAWVLYLVIFIILLSSKLALVVLLLFFIYYSFRRYAAKHKKQLFAACIAGLLILIGLFTINNPIKSRFADLADGDMAILKAEKFDQNTYFNGFKFRLLLWRFTYEILNEKNAWLLGVSPANAQACLVEKYIQMDMARGNGTKENPGYLKYNCHNQLLQSSLQSGLLGCFSFLAWCVILGIKTFRKKNILLSSLVFLIFCFFFTDSVFERQYGMVLCTVFPLLMLFADPAAPDPTRTLSPSGQNGNDTI